MAYQYRYRMFARAHQMTPEEAEKKYRTWQFMVWLRRQWQLFYEDREKIYGEEEHRQFDRWLAEIIASEQVVTYEDISGMMGQVVSNGAATLNLKVNK